MSSFVDSVSTSVHVKILCDTGETQMFVHISMERHEKLAYIIWVPFSYMLLQSVCKAIYLFVDVYIN